MELLSVEVLDETLGRQEVLCTICEHNKLKLWGSE